MILRMPNIGRALSVTLPLAFSTNLFAQLPPAVEEPDASDSMEADEAEGDVAADEAAAAVPGESAPVLAPADDEAENAEPTATETETPLEVAPKPRETQTGDESDPTKTDEISDADVDEFLAEAQLDDSGFRPSLELSGFADFNYTHFLIPNDDPWRILYNNKGHFGVGNLNVYFDGKLSETVRSFAEIRFTYLPHGNVNNLGPPATRASNESSDYTRNERDIHLGGLRIERAWLQWSPHQLFRVKVGHWLTPYGIWNVDHGSPTIVPVTRPFVVDEQLLPESQAGILVEGRYDVADHLAVEYGAGLSNGRGPIDMYYDYDRSKGLTGRLKVLSTHFGDLQVGVSGYHGSYTDADIDLAIEDTGLSSSDIVTTEFKEASFAADVRFTKGGLVLQSEFILNDRVYEEGGRSSAGGGLTPDNRRWGVYGLTGYRFDWFGVMPYVIGEYSPVPNASIPELPRKLVLLGGGLNIRPIAQVVVKLGYDQAVFPDPREASFEQHSIRRLQGQVAWAF